MGTGRIEPTQTKGEVLEALIAARGNISATARALGVKRRYVQEKIDKDAELKAMADDLLQEVLDQAEDNIFTAVTRGDLNRSEFVLKTLGKERGYTTRQESTGKNGDPLPFAGDISVNFVTPVEGQAPPATETGISDEK